MAIKTIEDLRVIHRRLQIPDEYIDICGLPFCPEPEELAAAGPDVFGRPALLEPQALRSWQQMRQAAAQDSVELHLVSAYRSIDYQAEVLARKVASGRSMEDVLTVNAAPGFSEHHSGRAIDIGTPGCPPLEEEFDQTQAFRWLSKHAKDFGFLLSYPKGSSGIINYEPWHWCFHA
ncbi:M15 family metallopeptidase [Pseudohongiella spirulinae]|nr:M15 family metallopeptidase [Pseudohongiella spirulinae]